MVTEYEYNNERVLTRRETISKVGGVRMGGVIEWLQDLVDSIVTGEIDTRLGTGNQYKGGREEYSYELSFNIVGCTVKGCISPDSCVEEGIRNSRQLAGSDGESGVNWRDTSD